ncbi:hypothetical protein [Janibacter melonis]|uniref:hypothetical protein n=1 Tax=Janibacter melonis TaxID=262209 RepID=UPI00191AFB06|nr:hypothetical protein [Janibacter melonis]
MSTPEDPSPLESFEVVAHGEDSWYLLAQGDARYLDVRCSRGAGEWSVLVELDPSERALLDTRGPDHLDRLARKISASSPGVDPDSPCTPRDVKAQRSAEVSAAVRRWWARQEG